MTSESTALHLQVSNTRAYNCAGGDFKSLFPYILDLRLPPSDPVDERIAAAS